MEVSEFDIEGLKLVRPKRYDDARGYFVEIWNRSRFAVAGIDVDFVQDNGSLSRAAATIRGLHYQRHPMAQAKLVRVVNGSILDVAVDIRRGSPTFGRFARQLLTANGGEQLYIPIGFAHGFCTLEHDTEVAYKVSAYFSPLHEAGLAWDDPEINIDWPLEGREPSLSERDRKLPRLSHRRSEL